jgi:hypothetical protein
MKPLRSGALALSLLFCGCILGGSDTTSGGGTEGDRKATRLVFPSGGIAEGIVVRLYPPDYNPVFPQDSLARLIREAVTDKDGFVRFPKTDSDAVYNLIARDTRTGLTAFVPGRRLREGFGTEAWLSGTWRLALTLTAAAPDTFSMSGFAYVPGSDIGQRWCPRETYCMLHLPLSATTVRVLGDGNARQPTWGRAVPLPPPPPEPGTYSNLRISPDGSRDSLWNRTIP